jgi:glycerol uptake facilitator-like aquaporin
VNKYIAEFLGTFALAVTVSLSLSGKLPVPTPVVAAVTLGVCVYTFGAISGTHINPAITIGLLSIGKVSVKDAVIYIVAQFAGGGLAMFVSGWLAPHAPLTVVDSGMVFFAEAFGTFWLSVGVTSVVLGKAPGPAAGLTIGGSLLLGIIATGGASNGVLNPAVALGIGSVSAVYLLAPIVGAAIAALLYRFIAAQN